MDKIAAVQNKIAQYLVDNVFEPWEEIVMNCELSEKTKNLSCALFYITNDPNDRRKGDIKLTSELTHLLRKLNDVYYKKSGERWGIFDLIIDSSGKYKFEFSYEKPKRLNGIFDEESHYRFENYLDKYKNQ